MAFLSSAQQAAIQAAITTDETTADLWRSPAAAGGKTGARADTGTDIALRVRPAGQDDSNLKRVPLAQPFNTARLYFIGKIALTDDVRTGDELRIGTTRYQVEGVGTFTNAQLIVLSTSRSGT